MYKASVYTAKESS